MKKFLSRILGFSLGPFACALIGLILVPVITRFISPEEYGKASMFSVAQGLLSVLIYMGMDQAYAREYAGSGEKKDDLLTNVMLLPMLVSLVVGAIIILLRDWVSYQLFGNENETLAVFLMAIMFPFMSIQHFALTKLRFEEKGFQYSLFCVLLKVWTLAVTVLLLVSYERSFRSVVYGAAIAEILNGAILYVVSLAKVKFSHKAISTRRIKGLLQFALPLIPATMISWALTSMDKLMLRSMCTYDALGLYAAAAKIVSALAIIQTCFVTIWVPTAFRWHQEGKDLKQFALVMKLVAAFMSCACFGILICKDIVGWFLGEDFARATAVFPFLMLQPIMYTMSETTTIGISFQRKTGYNIVVSVLSGVANLVLNYCLIPIWGGIGAAIATGMSYVVFFWVRTMISRRIWEKFPIWYFVLYTVLVLVNCTIHTFWNGPVAYVVSGISCIAVCAGNIPLVLNKVKALRFKDD